MKVGIIGGTGFVGGYIVEALLAAGHDVAALVRPGSESKLESASQCRIIAGDLGDKQAIEQLVAGNDAVIYNVGILREVPRQGITFQATQYQGAADTIEAAKNAGVRRLLLMSANGVKAIGTPYQETKYRAEEAALASGLDVTIFRPSVVFGDPRGKMEIATQLYQEMVRPPLPGVGFHTGWLPPGGPVLMSPVHVRDVADAFAAALASPETTGQRLVLGGPETLAWPEMLRRIARAVNKRKLIVPMPIGVMKLGATLLDWLPAFPVTREQLTMLAEGNSAEPATLKSLLGREPTAFSAENLDYLSSDS